jgi:diphosphomevalonate decarboxylase
MKAEASPNIAFIKYWGKINSTRDEDRNLATNPSFSLTLSHAKTVTQVTRLPDCAGNHRIFLNQLEASPKDFQKISEHLKRIQIFCGEDSEAKFFEVETKNNFPAGAGIASSASAFAALTLATLGEILGSHETERMLRESPEVISALARRGSGSASRSISGPFMLWDGQAASPWESKWKLFDTILIVSKDHKKVSSSEGHSLATSSPMFADRLQKIPHRLHEVQQAITSHDIHRLGKVLEEEALELHQVAESSEPRVDYLLDDSRKILKSLTQYPHRDFYFTLDAGPNVHVISARPIRTEMQHLLQRTGVSAEIWEDVAGNGPALLKNS